MDLASLLYPDLYFGSFTVLQIKSPDLEIFMILKGETYPGKGGRFCVTRIKTLTSLGVLHAE